MKNNFSRVQIIILIIFIYNLLGFLGSIVKAEDVNIILSDGNDNRTVNLSGENIHWQEIYIGLFEVIFD